MSRGLLRRILASEVRYDPGDPPDVWSRELYDYGEEVKRLLERSYGKPGHGLNGKDADLEPGGQLVVQSVVALDPVKAKSMMLKASLHSYASIVPPEDASEEDMDLYTELVVGSAYPGEWDGDYWVMTHNWEVSVPMEADWLDEGEAGIEKGVEALYHAIMKDSNKTEFEKEMADLSKGMEMSGKELRGEK